jgi:hypothetical protein
VLNYIHNVRMFEIILQGGKRSAGMTGTPEHLGCSCAYQSLPNAVVVATVALIPKLARLQVYSITSLPLAKSRVHLLHCAALVWVTCARESSR